MTTPIRIRASKVGEYYPISERTLRRYEKAGLIKLGRFRGTTSVKTADLERLLAGEDDQ